MKILSILSDHRFIGFDRMKVLLPDGCKIEMPTQSPFIKYLCRFRSLVRLFRLEPRCATFLTEDILILAFLRKLWFISLSKANIVSVENLRIGFSEVLTFCSMRSYGMNVVYYGDYGQNVNGEEIHIYKLDESLHSEICYTFPAGSVKHIHNILYDKYRDRFFIFTGDFGDDVGIYIANSDFSKVTPYLVGQQSYRAVIGKVLENGLLYATDAVMEDNYLYYVPFSDSIPRKLLSLGGSVIYGLILKEGLVFSTTVEPRPSVSSKIISLIDNRRGKGIKSNLIDVFYVSDDLACQKLKSYKKDFLPMRLFQYGCVTFPVLFDEHMEISSLPVNPVSVDDYDGIVDHLELSNTYGLKIH